MEISVVIPSFDRASFLNRAVKSVLNQSLLPKEIIIVEDGSSDDTSSIVKELQGNTDIPIHYIETEDNVGGSEARNIGVRAAKFDTVALLDDDDEWYSDKLEKQVKAVKERDLTTKDSWISFTSLHRYRNPENKVYEKIPNIDYEDAEQNRIVDYLFEVKGLKNIGFIQTSTILIPKKLLSEVPFTKGLPKHQDWDWLLRLEDKIDLEIIQIKEPMIIYHSDVSNDQRIGYVNRWRYTESWGESHKKLFSKLGYDSFIMNYVILGIASDSSLKKYDRIKEIIKRYNRISLFNKLKPYGLKVLIYSLIDLYRN